MSQSGSKLNPRSEEFVPKEEKQFRDDPTDWFCTHVAKVKKHQDILKFLLTYRSTLDQTQENKCDPTKSSPLQFNDDEWFLLDQARLHLTSDYDYDPEITKIIIYIENKYDDISSLIPEHQALFYFVRELNEATCQKSSREFKEAKTAADKIEDKDLQELVHSQIETGYIHNQFKLAQHLQTRKWHKVENRKVAIGLLGDMPAEAKQTHEVTTFVQRAKDFIASYSRTDAEDQYREMVRQRNKRREQRALARNTTLPNQNFTYVMR